MDNSSGPAPATDAHLPTGLRTPLRNDAFERTDEEKITAISSHFEAIMRELGLDLTDARRVVSARERAAFRTLADVARALPPGMAAPELARFSVVTRYFEVRGRLRMEQLVVEERSLLFRNGMEVNTLWRERVTNELARAPGPTR